MIGFCKIKLSVHIHWDQTSSEFWEPRAHKDWHVTAMETDGCQSPVLLFCHSSMKFLAERIVTSTTRKTSQVKIKSSGQIINDFMSTNFAERRHCEICRVSWHDQLGHFLWRLAGHFYRLGEGLRRTRWLNICRNPYFRLYDRSLPVAHSNVSCKFTLTTSHFWATVNTLHISKVFFVEIII